MTKRRMNKAAVMAPPWLPPTLLISATLDSSIASYGRHNGSRHSGSFSASHAASARRRAHHRR